MKKWEYLVSAPYPEVLEDTLCECGDEGWELVSTDYSTEHGITIIELIFKRPKKSGWKIINPND